MKLSKNKILASIIVIFVLAVSFWWGGNAPGLQGWEVQSKQSVVNNARTENTSAQTAAKSLDNTNSTEEKVEQASDLVKEDVHDKKIEPNNTEKPKDDSKDVKSSGKSKKSKDKTPNKAVEKPKSIETRPGGAEGGFTAQEKLDMAKKLAGGSSPGIKKGDSEYSEAKGMKIDNKTGKDKYLTDPVPDGKPIPVEPQNVVISDKELTCTFSVRCDTILDNMSWLDPEKVELVPQDGVIFAKQTVTFYEGESVFNVLLREMKKNKIHMEFVNTPMYNSAYIEGIHNLYEFDCGELSGWMYKVNGWFPNYGCSRYQLKQGDIVEWVYTCNLGIDVGGYYALGGE